MIKIEKYTEASALFMRDLSKTDVEGAAAEIIADVKERGDEALFDLAARFDGAKIDSIEVSAAEIDAAEKAVGREFMGVLRRAADNIREFHKNQIKSGFVLTRDGVITGQRVLPIERVGLYVPGGTAAYPSSVLMNCIPAKLAGCPLIVMTTPPSKDGSVSPAILAAAKVAGVDRVFRAGGAQAIAALAYGTRTVPAVDKIVGPGNAYVAEAKRQVFGRVAIDMIAGPSEILVVADDSASPAHIAADMLSQAEHDRLASALLVTDSMELAKSVARQIERRLKGLPREDIARASIENNGRIIVAKDMETAVGIANKLAPEHLEICTRDPFDMLSRVKNAGSVFLGGYCPEAVGDYLAGANHTLPTGGTARFSSPLSVDDFVKKMQYTYYTRDALEKISGDVEAFAKKEGLFAHAASVAARFEEDADE